MQFKNNLKFHYWMKKYLISILSITLFVSALLFTQTQASSLTSSQIDAIISLLQSFGADTTTVANVSASLYGQPTATTPASFCYNFNKNMGVGNSISSADAMSLENILEKEGLVNPPNSFSRDVPQFGEDIAAAVIEFQKKYGITPQSGFVGPLTRKKLNSLYGCENNTASVIPVQLVNPTQIIPTHVITQTHPASTPTCSLTSNKSSYILGETITYYWTSKNATHASFQQDTSGKDHLLLPGDKLSVSGSQTANASVIGNPEVILLVGGGVGTGSCRVMVNVIPSSANLKTATILTSSQITNTSPYIMGTASGVNQVGIIFFSQSGDKVYGSGLIPVVNGNWSVTVTPALEPGQYTIYVYDANNNQLTSKTMSIISSPVIPPVVSESSTPNIIITDISADELGVYVSYINNGSLSSDKFLIAVSSPYGSFSGNSFYPISVPTPGVLTKTGRFGSDLLGLGAGATANVTASVTWQNPSSGQTSNTFSKTITILGGGQVSNPITSCDYSKNVCITVISPVGGETLKIGQVYRIKWKSTNVNKVSLGYSTGPGSLNWIANNITNSDYYDWTVNVNSLKKLQIVIDGYGAGSMVTAQSSDYFNLTQ
jgi:hypothetical protein